MPPRLVEVTASSGHFDTISAIAERFKAVDFWKEMDSTDGTQVCRFVARPEKQQELIDQLQGALGKEKPWRITILPIEATIPELESTVEERPPEQAIREELYAQVDRGTHIDSTFLLLIVLSTIVAAIGLSEDSVAVVVAAMLIAPLLGPNIAMALGSTLGDKELVFRAALANAAGIATSVVCAGAIGKLFPFDGMSSELMAQTKLGYDNILLALASGAAGALSLTTQLPTTLVGVMVAVALLPPAVTLGYTIGTGYLGETIGAAALLAVNIVCVNLAAQIVFISKGIKPRTWIERRAAQQSVRVGLAIALGLLAVLVAIVYWRSR